MLKSLYITCYLAVIPMLLGVVIFYFIPTFHWDHHFFHVLLESGGALIAFMLALFITTMIKQQRLAINYIWLVACFITMGILDLAHSQVPPGQAFVWLHSSATFIGGFFAALIWLPEKASKKFAHKSFLFILIILSISFSIWSIILPEMSLVMLDEDKKFTLAAEILNLVGGLAFMISWGYFTLKYHQQHHPDSFYFSNNFCLFGLAGLLFEASILWDGNWWFWHLLRAFAYLFLALHFAKMYWDDLCVLKQKTHALEQEKERFEVLFEKSSYGIVLIEDGIFIDCNEQAFHMLGYDNKQALLKHPSDLSPPKQPDGQLSTDKSEKMIALCFQKGSHNFEWVHRKKNGDDFWVDVLLTKLNYQKKQIIHTVWRDISKEKEAEKVKDEFLANMSHELRTPINGVLGITELLANTQLTSLQRNYLETIQVSGKTLLLILNDILDSSKMDAGEIFFQENEFNPNDLLEHISLLLTQSAANKKIELITEIALPLPSNYALGDPDRIRQILMNLANNALKFTEQGEVSLKVVIQENNQKIQCRFEVNDTGIGIKTIDQEILFDSFTQVDSSDTRKQMGTGLGLSICKKLVEAMGGEIGVNSQLGKGSQFWFTLEFPCGGKLNHSYHHKDDELKTIDDDTINSDEKAIDLRSEKILVVEDAAINQMVIMGMLEQLGFSAICVNNGQEAVDIYKADEYQLIFMDLQMPVMDGYEATKIIREIEKTQENNRVPILALTANAMDGVSEKVFAVGMDSFLTKPIAYNILAANLNKWLPKDKNYDLKAKKN